MYSAQNVFTGFGVETYAGLVHQQQAGAVQERAHQFHLTFGAPRQLTHSAIQIIR